jgi:hypothetical protein
MSILTPQTPTEPSKEAKLNMVVNRIKNISANSYNEMLNTQKRGIDILWNNHEFSPQEIIDALGENAIKVFQYHGALTEYLISLAESEGIEPDVKYPKNAFTIDPKTGKITVTEDPYVPA